jgi:hypothetical protein
MKVQPPFDLIAFDADDTLWHGETLFVSTQRKFRQLLLHYHDEEWTDAGLVDLTRERLANGAFRLVAIEPSRPDDFALDVGEAERNLLQLRFGSAEAVWLLVSC